MKKSLLTVVKLTILLTFGIILHSCCTKKDCVNAFDMKEIKLTGFTQQESESITVSSYIQGSDFKNLIDSASTSAGTHSGNDDGDLTIWVPIDLNPKSDYLIKFKNTDYSFQISGININSQKCNSCFLSEDYYTVLTSYNVNGQLYTQSNFEIVK